MKLYLKSFYFIALPPIVLTTIGWTALYGLENLLLAFLISLCLWTSLTFSGVYRHFSTVRRMPYGMKKGATDIHQIREIELHETYEKIISLCNNSLSFLEGYRIDKNEDYAMGLLTVLFYKKSKYIGNKICFNINRIDEKRHKLKVEIKPIPSGVILDFGQNLKRIETIISYLHEHSSVIEDNLSD